MLVSRLSGYALLVALGAYALAFWFSAPPPNVAGTLFTLSFALVAVCATGAFLTYVLWLALVEREPSPIMRVKADCSPFLSPRRLAEKLGPMLLAFVLLGLFGTYKSLITHIQPFYLDGFLSDLDRAVFGTDAWRISHALIGPQGTLALETAYRLWFAELALSLIFFSVAAKAELQRRFFLSFFACWVILGIIGATAMSSAGPCFLWLIEHPYADRYAGMFPLLAPAPVALQAQSHLADAYISGGAGAFLGISAMPSMHVAFSALIVAAARHYGRIPFTAALIFFVLIFVGSVHLGWHYASDGVIGAGGALLIWRLTRSAATVPTRSARRKFPSRGQNQG